MNVLHVVASAQRRGAETFAADLVHRLISQGATQEVAVVRGLPRQVEFGVPTHEMTSASGDLSFRSGAGMRLRSLVRELGPSVVQAHGGDALQYATMASPARSIVYRRIGGSPPRLRGRVRRAAIARLMRRAARVVAVADRLRKETIEEFGLEPERVVTIPNGVDPARIAPRRSRDQMRSALGIDPDVPVVLSVGALSWEKDPLVHVDVARRLAATRAGLVHLMAGDGPKRSEVLVSADPRVTRILGSRGDVGDLIAAADVLLFASRPDGMEGMPAVAIEAAMLGLPLAGYDVAGIGEVVCPCRSGVLVEHGDVDALTDAAGRLLDDRELAARIRAEAPTRAGAFDITMIAARYLAVYEEVAAGR